jgi:acetate kinase
MNILVLNCGSSSVNVALFDEHGDLVQRSRRDVSQGIGMPLEQGIEDARLALDMYWHRIRKYIGAYFAVLGRVDALVFTGGVGENDARTRAAVCRGLDVLGLRVDATRNRLDSDDARPIHDGSAPTPIFVIPTDEEAAIARQVLDRLGLEAESSEGGKS